MELASQCECFALSLGIEGKLLSCRFNPAKTLLHSHALFVTSSGPVKETCGCTDPGGERLSIEAGRGSACSHTTTTELESPLLCRAVHTERAARAGEQQLSRIWAGEM